MEVKYEQEQGKNYLIVEDENIDFNSYPVQMIVNNNMLGTLNTSVRTINLKKMIYYDITSKLSLKQILEIKKLNSSEVISIINALVRMAEGLENYLLSEDNCILP